jgi:hypothetical protein
MHSIDRLGRFGAVTINIINTDHSFFNAIVAKNLAYTRFKQGLKKNLRVAKHPRKGGVLKFSQTCSFKAFPTNAVGEKNRAQNKT